MSDGQYLISNSNYNIPTQLISNPAESYSAICANSTNVYYCARQSSVNYLYKIDIAGTVTEIGSNFGSNLPVTGMGIVGTGSVLTIFTSNAVNTAEIIRVTSPNTSPVFTVFTQETYFDGLYIVKGTLSLNNSFNSVTGCGYIIAVTPVGCVVNFTLIEETLKFSGSSGSSALPALDFTGGCNFYSFVTSSGIFNFIKDSAEGGSVHYYNESDGVVNSSSITTGGDASYFLALQTGDSNVFLYGVDVEAGVTVIRCYLFDPASEFITQQSSYTFTVDISSGRSDIFGLTYSDSGGSGLNRFYYSGYNGGYGINKLYQTTGGSSTGGDPHISLISGGEIKFYDERKVLLFSTTGANSIREVNEEKIKIWCDSFCVKNISKFDFGSDISSDQMEKLFKNESYLNNVFIEIGDYPEIIINSITLKSNIDGNEVTLTHESKSKKVSVKIDPIKFLKDGETYHYRSNIKSPFKFDVIKYRNIEIIFDEKIISIEIIRTKCIHLSDVNITCKNIDLDLCSGAIITGKLDDT